MVVLQASAVAGPLAKSFGLQKYGLEQIRAKPLKIPKPLNPTA